MNIDFTNFHDNTKATFTACEQPTRPADFTSESGSEYWDTGDGVIRRADHYSEAHDGTRSWVGCGHIRSCYWILRNEKMQYKYANAGYAGSECIEAKVTDGFKIKIQQLEKKYNDRNEVPGRAVVWAPTAVEFYKNGKIKQARIAYVEKEVDYRNIQSVGARNKVMGQAGYCAYKDFNTNNPV